MPRLWNDTIEAHRREVRDAILDVTARLVREGGLRAVTMSQVAEETGIGRATLYKYFSDVDAILLAWHDDEIGRHLRQLAELRDASGSVDERLEAVLEGYAIVSYESHGPRNAELAAFLHQGDHVSRAARHLRNLIRELLVEGADAGVVRDDVAADELASYCLHALSGAGTVPSKAAVRRLVAVTLDGLRRMNT